MANIHKVFISQHFNFDLTFGYLHLVITEIAKLISLNLRGNFE